MRFLLATFSRTLWLYRRSVLRRGGDCLCCLGVALLIKTGNRLPSSVFTEDLLFVG